jgi:hypothetical protein
VDQLQELIGVDVAASNDTTGDFQRGNNWDLEYQTGPIEAQNPFSEQLQQSYSATLATRTYAAGSYVIDMGQPQTIGNGLKPYGLLYDLVTNHRIPVSWAIEPNKDWAFKSDGPLGSDTIGNIVDFTAMADHDWNPNTASISKNYSGGSFIIQASLMTPGILSTINSWRTQGVVVDPITETFDAFIYDDVTSFPKAVLDAAKRRDRHRLLQQCRRAGQFVPDGAADGPECVRRRVRHPARRSACLAEGAA